MAYRVGIVGASGYGGAELVRLLAGHPALQVATVAAHSQAGEPVTAAFPNLVSLHGARSFDMVDLDTLAGLDLVFLATPHDASIELGAALHDTGTPTVDLSAAFRLDPDGFATWYGAPHPRPDLLPAVYGLPELHRAQLREAALIAAPGCYPTATLLALAPLAGLLAPDSIVVDAKSGTSGAGRAAKEHLQFSSVHGDLVAYGAPAHRHTGEIEQWLPGGLGPISFTPHLVPMSRGLLATCYATLRPGVTPGQVEDALSDAYTDEPFVHVLPSGSFPHTKAVAGSNGAQVSALVDERTQRVLATCAIDNLGKGAAGQALQAANLRLGIDETAGLTAIGVYP